MCTIGDDNVEDIENLRYMPKKDSPALYDKCNKCREQKPFIILRFKDKYCKECFLAGTVHKFKALLGKHKLIRPDDRVLVIYKCGHSVSALLHFIRTGLDLETHKKLRFKPFVLFVEEQIHATLKERKDLLAKVEEDVVRYDLLVYFISITQILADTFNPDSVKSKWEYLEQDENESTLLQKYLTKQVNETNIKDYVNIKMRQLWIEVAKHLKCKFIFSPDISNDIASQILIDISLGRGSHVSLDTGFCDSRDEVKILRPLRLFDAKELAYYNHLNGLEPVIFKSVKIKESKSVQGLIQNFVDNLQVNYPATVTTILKTGDKLSLNSNLLKTCNFCKAPLEEYKKELTSAEATQFSHWISTQNFHNNLTPQERCNTLVDSFANLNCDNFCFSCQKLKL